MGKQENETLTLTISQVDLVRVRKPIFCYVFHRNRRRKYIYLFFYGIFDKTHQPETINNQQETKSFAKACLQASARIKQVYTNKRRTVVRATLFYCK
jgi:hypothetical protein